MTKRTQWYFTSNQVMCETNCLSAIAEHLNNTMPSHEVTDIKVAPCLATTPNPFCITLTHKTPLPKNLKYQLIDEVDIIGYALTPIENLEDYLSQAQKKHNNQIPSIDFAKVNTTHCPTTPPKHALDQANITFEVQNIPCGKCVQSAQKLLMLFLTSKDCPNGWALHAPITNATWHWEATLSYLGDSTSNQTAFIKAFNAFAKGQNKAFRLGPKPKHRFVSWINWIGGKHLAIHHLILANLLTLLALCAHTPWLQIYVRPSLLTWLTGSFFTGVMTLYTTGILAVEYLPTIIRRWREDPMYKKSWWAIWKACVKQLREPTMQTLMGLVIFTAWASSVFPPIFTWMVGGSIAHAHNHLHCIYWILGMHRLRNLQNPTQKSSTATKEHLHLCFQQRTFYRWNQNQQHWDVCDLTQLFPGDVIAIYPGQTIPTDGYLLGNNTIQVDAKRRFGSTHILPIAPQTALKAGDVYQGKQTIFIKVEKRHYDSILPNALLATQKTDTPRWEKQWVGYFTKGMLIASLLTLIVCMIYQDFHRAIMSFMSVLVACCPCSLLTGLPYLRTKAQQFYQKKRMATLFQPGKMHEKADHIFLDFSGTLTFLEKPKSFASEQSWQGLKLDTLFAAFEAHMLRQKTTYANPTIAQNLAGLVNRDLLNQCTNACTFSNVQTHASKQGFSTHITHKEMGQRATITVETLNNAPNHLNHSDTPGRWLQVTLTPAKGPPYIGYYFMQEKLKKDAKSWLGRKIKDQNVHIISGSQRKDILAILKAELNDNAFQAVQKKIGIYGALSPEKKAEKIEAILSERTDTQGLFVGDSTNDLLALDVLKRNNPILLERLTTLALGRQYQADINLMDAKRFSLKAFERLAATYRWHEKVIFIAALCYNTCAVILAMLGYLDPMLGSMGMSLFSFLITGYVKWCVSWPPLPALHAHTLKTKDEKANKPTTDPKQTNKMDNKTVLGP